MKDNYLLPFIRAIESTTSLSEKKQDILCLLLTAMQIEPDGLQLAELHKVVKLSRDRMYRVLTELEADHFIIRTKKGKYIYVKPNIDSISALADKYAARKNLASDTLKLRLSGNRG